MIKNYIQSVELLDYFPKLNNNLWSTQTNYTQQINLAFSNILDKLHSMKIETERIYTPLDLLNDTIYKDTGIVTQAFTTATTGVGQHSNFERRVALTIGSVVGSWNFYVDGSQRKINLTGTNGYGLAVPSTTDPSWENATTFVITSSYANTIVTQTLDKTYEYLRYRLSPVAGGSSISTSIIMIQTVFDEAVKHRALEIIYQDFMKEPNDIWDLRRQLEHQAVQEALETVKYNYDYNTDGLITEDEEDKRAENKIYFL